MLITGWPICAIRCGSARPWPPPRENHATFIEVSPHPLLTYAIGDTLQSTSSTDRFIVTSALKRGEDETLFFHTQLAALGVTALKAGGGRLADIPSVAVAAFEVLGRESVACAAVARYSPVAWGAR